MSKLPDIDIDFADRERALQIMPGVAASMTEHGVTKKHNTGVYYTKIPVDPTTGTSTIDYKTAEDRGYFKLDLLNVAVYQKVKSEEHLSKLMKQEPLWELLWKSKEFCEQVIHVGNYYDLICSMKPDSIPRMAMLLSIIRPGKAHLQNKTWKEVGEEFKKIIKKYENIKNTNSILAQPIDRQACEEIKREIINYIILP